MSSHNILPCPFCGGQAIVFKNRVWRYNVRCTKCEMHQTSFSYETEEEAIERWNMRKPMDRIEDRLTTLFQHHRATKKVQRLVFEIVRDTSAV